MTFEAPDLEAFPALKLAVECGKAGGTLPCAFNAANEESVYAFLDNKIKYLDIPMTIEKIIVRHQNILQPVIEDIEQTDAETRRLTREILKTCNERGNSDMTTILAAIFVFGVLITVHEFGHFITAKMTGMRVDEFAIGFGPNIFQKKLVRPYIA